ncbi:MAG: beta-lactamase family protein, partial [Armatimonadetes bacterium]|nr:beta-lactamase family protein [Armatimonadota bacterium]
MKRWGFFGTCFIGLLVGALSGSLYSGVKYLSLGSPPARPSSSSALLRLTDIPAAKLEEKVQAAVEEKIITGAVLWVSSPDAEPFVKAFGTNGQGAPLSTDTAFDLASLTKAVVTAPLVLDLVAKGRFTLETPIRHWFDQLEGEHREITVGQLLLHTSGLPPGLSKRFRTSAEASVARQPLRYPPGRRFLYSDLDYLLLGRIVEIETGMTLDEAARKTLFLPVGMEQTCFQPRFTPQNSDGNPRSEVGIFTPGTVRDPLARRMGGVAGHAGLFSNATDLAAFAAMLLDGGMARGQRVLPAAAVRYLTDPVAVDPRTYRTHGMDALSA